jgi:two-component system chemotaxis response regulator CheB
MTPVKLIVIGASAGGLPALQKIFSLMTSETLPPLAVALHLARDAKFNPGMVFASSTRRRVLEAEDKMPFENDCVYTAPPGYHLLAGADGYFSLSVDEPVHFSRPSIDVLFESAAHAFGPEVAGMLLTGANEDGAAGLKAIQARGGKVMVQDPETAVAKAMPAAALKLVAPDVMGSLEVLAAGLSRFAPVEAKV